ncbi:hypothetical protein D9M72_454070 [compost metagenome]
MVGQAGAVGVEVADGDGLRDLGVGQRKPGQVRAHRRIPADAATADLACHHGGADGFRHRCQLEHGVGIDRRGVGHQPAAEAFGVNGLVAAHHGDGHARHAGTGHQVGGQLVELGNGLGDPGFGNWLGRVGRIVIAAAAGGQGGDKQAAQRGSEEMATLLQFAHGSSP